MGAAAAAVGVDFRLAEGRFCWPGAEAVIVVRKITHTGNALLMARSISWVFGKGAPFWAKAVMHDAENDGGQITVPAELFEAARAGPPEFVTL